MTLSRIQSFEALFAQLGFIHPKNAASYYVILIEQFPVEFETIKRISKKFSKPDTTSVKLRAARSELLKRGFIAQVVHSDGDIIEKFGRQSFLPVNPAIAFELNRKKLEPLFDQNELKDRTKVIKNLCNNYYKENFKKYGLGIEEGTVTILYGKPWLLYTLINNLGENSELMMMLSGLGSFVDDHKQYPPYSEYNEHMLKMRKIKMLKAIYQINDENGIAAAKLFRDKYPGRVEIKYSPSEIDDFTASTSRKVTIDNEIAIDGRKILPKQRDDPSYIGTAYLQKDLIGRFKNHFNIIWESSKALQ